MLVKHLKHELLRQTLPAESLIWICRQRHDASKPLFGLPVGIAMLSLIEQDHMDGGPTEADENEAAGTENDAADSGDEQ